MNTFEAHAFKTPKMKKLKKETFSVGIVISKYFTQWHIKMQVDLTLVGLQNTKQQKNTHTHRLPRAPFCRSLLVKYLANDLTWLINLLRIAICTEKTCFCSSAPSLKMICALAVRKIGKNQVNHIFAFYLSEDTSNSLKSLK